MTHTRSGPAHSPGGGPPPPVCTGGCVRCQGGEARLPSQAARSGGGRQHQRTVSGGGARWWWQQSRNVEQVEAWDGATDHHAGVTGAQVRVW